MSNKVTVITLFENDSPKIAGVLNDDLVRHLCHQAGINSQELGEHLTELADKGLLELSETTLH